MLNRNWTVLWLAFAVGTCAGCGDGGLVPVEGTVKLDGRPMSDVHVTFFPVGAGVNDGTLYRAVTDAEGRFSLFRPTDRSEGALPGVYRVTLSTAVAGPNDDETTPLPPEQVPARYRDANKEYSVPEGGKTDANFDLKSR